MNIVAQEMPNNTVNSGKALCFSNANGFAFTYCGVICRSDGAAIIVPQNDLGNLYFRYFLEQISPLFKKVIKNLFNTRKHLALQLEFEFGNISEEQFATEEKTCLFETEKIPFSILRKEIELLFRLSNMALDSDEVSEILNCSIDDAEKAIKDLFLEDQ